MIEPKRSCSNCAFERKAPRCMYCGMFGRWKLSDQARAAMLKEAGDQVRIAALEETIARLTAGKE